MDWSMCTSFYCSRITFSLTGKRQRTLLSWLIDSTPSTAVSTSCWIELVEATKVGQAEWDSHWWQGVHCGVGVLHLLALLSGGRRGEVWSESNSPPCSELLCYGWLARSWCVGHATESITEDWALRNCQLTLENCVISPKIKHKFMLSEAFTLMYRNHDYEWSPKNHPYQSCIRMFVWDYVNVP